MKGRLRRAPQQHKSPLGEVWILGMLFTLCALQMDGSNLLLASDESETTITKQAKRPVTVADAITMTKVGDFDLFWGTPLPDQLAHFSPDGTKFVVIARKGSLESNSKEYSLLLWRTDEISRSPSAQVILTMSSSSNRQAINHVAWLDDSERIAFLGEHPGELQQLYVYNLRSRVLNKVINHPTNILSYSMTPNGEKIAYIAEQPISSIWDDQARREGVRISTQAISTLIKGQQGGADYGSDELFFQSGNQISRQIKIFGKISSSDDTFVISPNGEYLLLSEFVREVPEVWKEYSDPEMQRVTTQKLLPGQFSELKRCELIDTTTGENRILLNSPQSAANSSRAAWSPDSQSVVISGIYLPLENIEGEERFARRSSSFVIEKRILNDKFIKITNEDLILRKWNSRTNLLEFQDWKLARGDRSQGEELFRRRGDNWEKLQDATSAHVLPKIVVEEDINTPAKIMAVTPGNKAKTVLFDPNPQFKDLRFAKVEAVQWKGSDGHDVRGGLYYPVNYVSGTRYPLVIQTHGWAPNAFWIDGPFTTAFAAQPLAGKDVMVLQADEGYTDMGVPSEVTREVASFEGAIDYLDKRGLVDPRRVGIIGFSRTCLFVKYALAKSKYHFAAASVTDGTDAGYLQYLLYLNNYPGVSQDDEALNGGIPFGHGWKSWQDRSPVFSIEHLETPLRILAENPDIVLSEWEWFAALTRLGKPVEMIALQDGEHILQKPWERMVSQQGNVDWFVFWLKDEEDPDPAKVEQYARWRKLRKLQQENGATLKASPNPVN